MHGKKGKTMSKFTQVSASRPCPICSGTSKCAFTDNAVICHRVPSDCPRPDHFNPSKTVWLHRLANVPYDELPDSAKKRRGKAARIPVGPFAASHFTSLSTDGTRLALCRRAGEVLGVEARALESLDMRWCPAMKMAVVPMKSYDGTVIGMNGRHLLDKDGRPSSAKMNAAGSVDGLFLPLDLDLYDGRLLVCEGASDTAAALSLGFRNVVGRSSCRTGVQLLRLFCRHRRIDAVTIVADRDKPTAEAPDGVGMKGAQELAASLADCSIETGRTIAARIVQPAEGLKDLRDWYRADPDAARQALAAELGGSAALF